MTVNPDEVIDNTRATRNWLVGFEGVQDFTVTEFEWTGRHSETRGEISTASVHSTFFNL